MRIENRIGENVSVCGIGGGRGRQREVASDSQRTFIRRSRAMLTSVSAATHTQRQQHPADARPDNEEWALVVTHTHTHTRSSYKG